MEGNTAETPGDRPTVSEEQLATAAREFADRVERISSSPIVIAYSAIKKALDQI